MNPHESRLLALFLSQFLFGCLYSVLVHWVSVRNFWPGSTAFSVVVGDAATLIIQWLFIPQDWPPIVTFVSFACSGFPMFITYQIRHQMLIEKKKADSKQRRPWPNFANQMRDNVIMDISKMIADIEEAAKDGTINAGFLLRVTNGLHGIIRVLKSV